ncbi:MAG: hypothetical protein PF693_00390 [Spirochaetia bacterium]|nr:hypothetical protein [Spirochaetia bacterium]
MSVSLDVIDFGLVKNCLKLGNGTVDLILSTEFGPRILFYGFTGEGNLFKNFDEQLAAPKVDEWQSYGGHRLWHAPEVFPRTYYPDNDPVPYDWNGRTLTLMPIDEKGTKIGKKISIDLSIEGSRVVLDHEIINKGVWDVELAAWCLSVMAPGGRVIIPQEEYISHPEALVPARPLVLWHFTKMNDPRFIWGERYIQLKQDDSYPSKQKIGVNNTKGWAAYCLEDMVFLKQHPFKAGAVYPDMGCNAEFFTQPGFLEIESLSPLTRLVPGGSVSQKEVWSLHHMKVGKDESELDRIQDLIQNK